MEKLEFDELIDIAVKRLLKMKGMIYIHPSRELEIRGKWDSFKEIYSEIVSEILDHLSLTKQ